MRIGCDVDGVLYPYAEEFNRLNSIDSPIDKWAWYEDFGMTREEFCRTSGNLIVDGHLFWEGEPYSGVADQLRRLKNAGHSIVLITNRNFTTMDRTATESWLGQYEIPYDELHFVKDKTTVEVDFHVDDNVDNARAMAQASVQSALLDRPWNRDAYGVWRVFSLEEYVNSVLVAAADKAADTVSLNSDRLRESIDRLEEVRVVSETGGAKGQKLARLGSLDPEALLKVAEVAGFGEHKYSRLNYMNGYDWSLSFDAGMRHRLSFWAGEDFDPESGLPHLAHAVWHDLCQLAFFLKNIGTDDRYRRKVEE